MLNSMTAFLYFAIAIALLCRTEAICTPLVAGCVCETTSVSQADLDAAKLTLRTAIQQQSPTSPALNQGDIVGLLVRLAFHDAAEYDRQQSADNFRADGCIDLSLPDNNGLSAGINMLQPLWIQHCSVFSRADFWYLASIVSLNIAEPSGSYNIPFNYGRIDAANCQGASGRLPNAEGGFSELTRVFVNQMGLTTRQAVVLLGAHTLGRAVSANSGYSGSWVPQTKVFGNTFFKDILRIGWKKRTIDGSHHQWDGPPNSNTMMLNTDMSLGFDSTELKSAGTFCGQPPPGQPAPPACATSGHLVDNGLTSYTLIQQYGNDNGLFLSEFKSSFVAMLSAGYGNSLTVYNTPNPTASPTITPTISSAPTTSLAPTLNSNTSNDSLTASTLSNMQIGLIAAGSALISIVMYVSWRVLYSKSEGKSQIGYVHPEHQGDLEIVKR